MWCTHACTRTCMHAYSNTYTQMTIQKMDGGPECAKLPVAHTCFNVLDLPPYRTKAKMK